MSWYRYNRPSEFQAGPVAEGEEDKAASVGSVSGGGRYDQLVDMFSSSGRAIPCVGLSIGVERLMAIAEQRQASPSGTVATRAQVMVIVAQKNMIDERFKLLSMLLDAGITVRRCCQLLLSSP